MKPVTLALKNYKVNPFTGRGNGELMVIHQCTNCARISSNRIAGDDNEHQILSLLKEFINLNEKIVNQFKNLGLELITTENTEAVLVALYGINYQSYIKNIEDLF